MMTISDTAAIPLDAATLCVDCQCVGNGLHACPACGSSALMSLATVLDRKTPPKPWWVCQCGQAGPLTMEAIGKHRNGPHGCKMQSRPIDL